MKKKWMLLMGILVFAMFVGVSMARWNGDDNDNGNGDCDRDRDRDCVCDLLLDENNDGICDFCCGDIPEYDGDCEPNGPDDDGDGIPNGQDDDYVPPEDGTGDQHGRNR